MLSGGQRSFWGFGEVFEKFREWEFHTRKGEERAFSLGNADGGDSVRASDVRSIARGIVCCSAGELASLASAP